MFYIAFFSVHVRRTDKVGTEADFHPIQEYMTHVENYYDLLEKRQPVTKRRIYLATDEPKLLEETRKKYINLYPFIDTTCSVVCIYWTCIEHFVFCFIIII